MAEPGLVESEVEVKGILDGVGPSILSLVSSLVALGLVTPGSAGVDVPLGGTVPGWVEMDGEVKYILEVSGLSVLSLVSGLVALGLEASVLAVLGEAVEVGCFKVPS